MKTKNDLTTRQWLLYKYLKNNKGEWKNSMMLCRKRVYITITDC